MGRFLAASRLYPHPVGTVHLRRGMESRAGSCDVACHLVLSAALTHRSCSHVIYRPSRPEDNRAVSALASETEARGSIPRSII